MVAIQTPVMEPFRAWLAQFDPAPIVNRENGADRVALLVDDRDDEIVRRVYGNAVAVLGDTWNHRFLRERGSNDLLASSVFWQDIPEEHVLIYQRDTVLFRQVPEDALTWDMIGPPCGPIYEPGWILNGGLSLRRRTAMLAAIRSARRHPQTPEDVYFTQTLRDLGGALPDIETAAHFAVENPELYLAPPVGVHGTDKRYLPDAVATWLVREALGDI